MELVKEFMSRSVISVPKYAAIDVAIDLMVEHNVSGMPVVDTHNLLVGLITEYDILNLYGKSDDECAKHEPCEKYMTTEVKTVQQDASLEVAATIFRAASLRRLLVLDGERFVGILSRRDIVRRIRDKRAGLAID